MEKHFEGQQGNEKINYSVDQLLEMGEINDHLTFVRTRTIPNNKRKKGLSFNRKRKKNRKMFF